MASPSPRGPRIPPECPGNAVSAPWSAFRGLGGFGGLEALSVAPRAVRTGRGPVEGLPVALPTGRRPGQRWGKACMVRRARNGLAQRDNRRHLVEPARVGPVRPLNGHRPPGPVVFRPALPNPARDPRRHVGGVSRAGRIGYRGIMSACAGDPHPKAGAGTDGLQHVAQPIEIVAGFGKRAPCVQRTRFALCCRCGAHSSSPGKGESRKRRHASTSGGWGLRWVSMWQRLQSVLTLSRL